MVVVVVAEDGAAAAVSAALGMAGAVLTATVLAPPLTGGAAAIVVGGATPGVMAVSAGRVAYQPAAASAASAIRPTAIAAGATEPLRRTTVRFGATNGASPSAPNVASRAASSSVTGAAAELLTVALRAPRRLRPRSQDGIGANIGVSESCGAAPLVVRLWLTDM
ncbi:MAG: hypothetical protein JWP86_2284 [Phenylobacterium sp.]|nr:hypothetical protein [Phenylobacterium sp.]